MTANRVGACARVREHIELVAAHRHRQRQQQAEMERQWQWRMEADEAAMARQRRCLRLPHWQRGRLPPAGHEIARDHVLLLARTSENELPVAEKKNLLSRNSTPTRSAATAPPCAAGDQLDRADDSASMPAPALA